MYKKISIIMLLLLSISAMVTGCSSKKNRQELNAEVAPVKYDRDCIVTIVDDDGYFEAGMKLNQLAKKHNMRITVAGVVDFVDEHRDEWIEIEKSGNVEIISHSYSHTKMSEEADLESDVLKHEILDSVAYFSKHFTTPQISFIAPENTMCGEGYEILRQAGIYSIRQGGRGLNSLTPVDGTDGGQWYSLLTHGIGDVETTEERNAWVDDAIYENAWLIEMWHNVTEEGQEAGYQAISVPAADEHMAYISEREKEEKVWVASLTDATKYLYEKENASVRAFFDGKKIVVRLDCGIKGSGKVLFDYPLTVRVVLPQELEEIDDFFVNKDKLDIEEIQGTRTILLDLKPNSSCKITF